MATVTEFKKFVVDFAKLGGEGRISLGTSGFAGDGNRLFLNFDDVGILFPHEDARAFLAAAARAAKTLGFDEE